MLPGWLSDFISSDTDDNNTQLNDGQKKNTQIHKYKLFFICIKLLNKLNLKVPVAQVNKTIERSSRLEQIGFSSSICLEVGHIWNQLMSLYVFFFSTTVKFMFLYYFDYVALFQRVVTLCVCVSVPPLVGRSVGNAQFLNSENEGFSSYTSSRRKVVKFYIYRKVCLLVCPSVRPSVN